MSAEHVAEGVTKLAVSTRLKAESSIRSARYVQGYGEWLRGYNTGKEL